MVLEWQAHPATLKLHKALKELKDEEVKKLSHGATLGELSEQKTARVVGRLEVIDMILSADLVDKEVEE
jgi:hypothetical protein